MKYGSQTFYAALADTQGPGPAEHPKAYRMGAMGLADPKVASLRCFQLYSREAHRTVVDGDGMVRWVAQKQARVQAIIDRMSVSEGTATMTAIAAEAQCSPSTVSRTIMKLQSWAMYAIEVKRGRNGGIKVHRKGWERFWDLVYDARHRLKIARDRAWINLASRFRRGKKGQESVPATAPVTVTYVDARFSPKPKSFGDRVLYERAMLALEDPDGEYEAAHPITNVDEALLQAEDERRRRYAAVREAALAGDWERWEALRQAWDVD